MSDYILHRGFGVGRGSRVGYAMVGGTVGRRRGRVSTETVGEGEPGMTKRRGTRRLAETASRERKWGNECATLDGESSEEHEKRRQGMNRGSVNNKDLSSALATRVWHGADKKISTWSCRGQGQLTEDDSHDKRERSGER